jgi:hypothetical protein
MAKKNIEIISKTYGKPTISDRYKDKPVIVIKGIRGNITSKLIDQLKVGLTHRVIMAFHKKTWYIGFIKDGNDIHGYAIHIIQLQKQTSYWFNARKFYDHDLGPGVYQLKNTKAFTKQGITWHPLRLITK